MRENNRLYERYFKRLIDICLSLFSIIILSPIFILVWIMIKIKLGGKAIFVQLRPGLNGKIFKMYKFRTMTNEVDENGLLLPDSERLTDFGKKLRSTSLDELPELFNILFGDMSIVGPRPLLVEYLPLYSEKQARRHEVRPGLTGLAQVNGRNSISWKDKFELDVQYVDNIRFIEDFKIVLKTVKKVIIRDGINSDNSVSMKKFTGNDNA